KTYERASHLVLAIWDELGKTLLEQKPAPVAEPDVQTRVAQRLRWDRELAELTIVILGTPEQVILSGQVKTETQKLRALRLTTDTLGVSSVKEGLEIAPPQETTVVLPEE
ncbi:MAG TPA: BON domain-containing protein, partial [Gemmatales bacterium]|nr:BON domain-containing protein [Gemmatales bacterium]